MLALAISAVVVSGLGDRPQSLLGADNKTGYLAKLEEKLASPMLAPLISTAIPDCSSLTYASTDYFEVRDQDFGPTDEFYKSIAVKPAAIEHIMISGCGHQLQINLMALRLQSDPTDLKFTFQIVGQTMAGPLLQRDAYQYVAMATNAAQTLSGDTTTCGSTPMIYDTHVVVPADSGIAWKEIWFASKCGFKARIALDFIPKPDGGTTFSVHPLKPGE